MPQPLWHTARSPVGSDESVLSSSDRCGSSIDSEQVLDRERRSCCTCEAEMNGHDIVEAQRHEITHSALEHCGIETGLPVRRIGMTDRSEELDSRHFQIVQIVAVVDDAHGIGLDEAHPDVVTEGVGSRIEWRMESGNRVVHALDRSCQMVLSPPSCKKRLFLVSWHCPSQVVRKCSEPLPQSRSSPHSWHRVVSLGTMLGSREK